MISPASAGFLSVACLFAFFSIGCIRIDDREGMVVSTIAACVMLFFGLTTLR